MSRTATLAGTVIAMLVASQALAATEKPEDKWALDRLYPNVAAFDAAYKQVEGRFAKLEDCRGKLGESEARFKACIDTYYDLAKEVARLTSYASMTYDQDTKVASSLELDQRGNLLQTRFSEVTSYIRPEVLALGREKVDAFLKADPSLAIYRHPLDDTLRRAEHTRSAGEEEIIAAAGLVADAPYSLYGILSNADTPWPTIKLSDGTEARLDQAGYTKYRAVTNRDDRKKVFDAFWGTWKKYERTFGVALYSQIKRDTFYAKVRHYPNALASALDDNRIPEAVYRTLVKEVNAGLPTLHRYFRLRGKLLGVDQMRYYDIYPPMVKSDKHYSIDEAQRLVLEAVKPLGDDYVKIVDKGFKSRWMDVYPRPGKRSGAYSNGAAYDVNPYVLMNYNEDYESVSTLAHEWGHTMHSYLANTTQPFCTADYSIFLAEIASTLNEDLLLEKMLKEAKNDEEKLFYLGQALESLRGTFFRQTMFAEFELKTHEMVAAGEALTGARFTEVYADLLKRYHGDAEGVVKIDEPYTVEWAYIPHFYYNFYVYQYATSIAASSLIADRILAGEKGAVKTYLDLLSAGGSDYPFDLLKKAGVDLTSPEPYRSLIARMDRIMDQMEAILAKRA